MQDIAPGGAWPLTIIMVVIVSWIIYKYLVPRGYKEWRNAGLIQAFIIALYAEMYGFPLTIYILTSFLGIDIPWLHISGHLWSYLFGWGEAMAMVEMLIGYAFVFAGISIIVQGWREIYRVRNEQRLVTNGIYRYIRHPQYAGIFLAIFGQLIHWPTIPTLALSPVIVLAYYRLARREESELLLRFGPEYRTFMDRVPMFFPRWGDLGKLFGYSNSRRSAMPVDPVCKMTIDEKDAVGKAEYKGQVYHFCSVGCKTSLEKDPEEYIGWEGQ